MKYKCLVLDHDDTVVESTKNIHYPSFIEFLEKFRPGVSMSFEEYMQMNCDPGFLKFCFETLNFSEKEMDEETTFWIEYVKKHVPIAYSGFKEILNKYKEKGGIICVVSHSMSENILRDYMENELPVPDEIFGWDSPVEERKPSPYPMIQIMNKYGLNAKDILIVDDLKPGYDMAKSCGIDFACAGWAYELPEIHEFMQKNSDYYLEDVKELEKIIF